MKITKLSKYMEKKIDRKRLEWLGIGLSTDTNKGKAEKWIREVYAAAGLAPPRGVRARREVARAAQESRPPLQLLLL